ncbi:thioredoxin domain-containing protein [Microvirga aerilata]|uniref:thioredoxin domain-containing protein n=1 Tax=Microvirga aerilata TaxID=670292 RepID=UPI00363EA9D3
MILSRRTLLAGLALSGTTAPAFAQSAPEPQLIPVELIENTLNLPSIVRLGHKHGDVIMVEYFDYNCPWCKRSAESLPPLLKAEPELSYVLVNFAVLSNQSVAATRAALAYLQLYGPERYLPFTLPCSACAAR